MTIGHKHARIQSLVHHTVHHTSSPRLAEQAAAANSKALINDNALTRCKHYNHHQPERACSDAALYQLRQIHIEELHACIDELVILLADQLSRRELGQTLLELLG